jgi:hypothetical protein
MALDEPGLLRWTQSVQYVVEGLVFCAIIVFLGLSHLLKLVRLILDEILEFARWWRDRFR